MDFTEIHSRLSVLVEKADVDLARTICCCEAKNISAFSNSERYKIKEKLMILEYKSQNFHTAEKINSELLCLSKDLDAQYLYSALIWKINIYISYKMFDTALRYANDLKKQFLSCQNYDERLLLDLENTVLRIYIGSKKYKRMKKQYRKLISKSIDEHSKSKALMNVGVAYFSIGEYNESKRLFKYIKQANKDLFFSGCANLYLARMTNAISKTALYEEAISDFEKLGNSYLSSITKQELRLISGIQAEKS